MSVQSTKDLNLYEVLETLAFQQASGTAKPAGAHNSRMARVLPDSWQARLFRDKPELRHVESFDDFKAAMAEPHSPVLFIPDTVTIDAAAIDRVCTASGHDKIIIWEDGGLA